MGYACNTGTREAGTGRTLGSLASQSSLLGKLQASERPYFKIQTITQVVLSHPHKCSHVRMCSPIYKAYMCTHKHIYSYGHVLCKWILFCLRHHFFFVQVKMSWCFTDGSWVLRRQSVPYFQTTFSKLLLGDAKWRAIRWDDVRPEKGW